MAQHAPRFLQIVEAVRVNIRECTVSDVRERQARGEQFLLFDVREESEFAAGHLPYARSLPLSELKKRLDELPKNKPVVAYCRGPFCMMAKEAVVILHRRGYRAFKLDDGVAEWRARGLPVEQ